MTTSYTPPSDIGPCGEAPKFTCTECGIDFDDECDLRGDGMCDDCADLDYDEPDELYDREGNVVWSKHYEGQFVDRVCDGCNSPFRGLPSYGYCNSCADIRERGGELPNNY